MEYRTLGISALNVSVISMGCWAIGGRGWGPVDDRRSHEAITAALDAGINFFDTADVYGFGHSEEVLGRVLSGHPDALVATKVGLRRDGDGRRRHDLSPTYIREACEASLRRLGRERIDLYQIHWPDPDTPLEAALETMATLVDEEKIRYFGASNLNAEDMRVAVKMPGFIAYQDRFNLIQRPPEAVGPTACRNNQIGFIAYEPLLKGLLTGKYRERPEFGRKDHRRKLDVFGHDFNRVQQSVEPLVKMAREHRVEPGALALALLLNEATTVAAGARTAAQARENAGASDIPQQLLDAARTELAAVFVQQ